MSLYVNANKLTGEDVLVNNRKQQQQQNQNKHNYKVLSEGFHNLSMCNVQPRTWPVMNC